MKYEIKIGTITAIQTPEQEWMPDELATVGEVFLEVTRILTKKYSNYH